MAPNRQISVMLVDDHEIMRDGLREVLQRAGDFEVVGEAGDGAAAVRVAQNLNPDVIVMDVMMPLKNGIDACREITAPSPASTAHYCSALYSSFWRCDQAVGQARR